MYRKLALEKLKEGLQGKPDYADTGKFYPAAAYHQNYATLHPDSLYIRFNDAPKMGV